MNLSKTLRIVVASSFMGCLSLASCMTGDKFSRLSPGMTKAQVISMLGSPKGYEQNGDYETLQYPGGLISGWSYDTADFYVTLHHGLVEKYGAANVQKGHPPGIIVFPAPAPNRAH
jgi:hypothetical protein